MKIEEQNKLLQIVGGLTVPFAVLAYASMWNGFLVSILWDWFVIGLFDVPAIGVAQAIGLSLVVGAFTVKFKKNDGESIAEVCARVFVMAPVFCGCMLITGFVVKKFI